MWFFSEEQLLLLHYKLIDRYGGVQGIRDVNRVSSAVSAPKTSHYTSIFDKAAVYSRNIIGDHPFVDGNKRTGIMASVIFLEKNNIPLTLQKKELEDLAVSIASQKLSVEDISIWLASKATTD